MWLLRPGQRQSLGSFLWRALIVALVTANALLIGVTLNGFAVSEVGHDWAIFVEAGQRAGRDDLYT